MIVFIEPKFMAWQHEEVNAGLIKMISKAAVRENVVVYAHRSHIRALRAIGLADQICCRSILVDPNAFYQKVFNAPEHIKKLQRLIKCHHLNAKDTIIFLSATPLIILAANLVSAFGNKPHIILVCHAELDIKILDAKKAHEKSSLRTVMNLTAYNRHISYISFNPFCNRYLSPILRRQVLDHIHFLHHPFESEPLKQTDRASRTTVIGIYGACVNSQASSYVRYVNKLGISENYLFKILTSNGFNRNTRSVKFSREHTSIHVYSNGLTRQERLRELSEMDWILLPYGKESYRVSASGILADAIRCEIPVLTLDSPILKYYTDRGIGYTEKSLRALALRLQDILHNGESVRTECIKNIRELKKVMASENNLALEKLLMVK